MKREMSVVSPKTCQAPETFGVPECATPRALGAHKYCGEHSKTASRLAKRRDRRQWRAKGQRYWLDRELRETGDPVTAHALHKARMSAYMRAWRQRKRYLAAEVLDLRPLHSHDVQISPGRESVMSLPLKERQAKANALLDRFSEFTDYKHGNENPYRRWLSSLNRLDSESVVRWLRAWYPVSRHQPQILLLCAAAYPDWVDRQRIMWNYREEDGHAKPGDNPHYDLLEQLINKLGGKLAPDAGAEDFVGRFHDTLGKMTPAEASGVLAAVEHPALDISWYLHRTMQLCGFPDLLKDDLYLTLHVDVEPSHIIWSHSTALRYMQRDRDGVVGAFNRVMSFWRSYWPLAFSRLNFPTA